MWSKKNPVRAASVTGYLQPQLVTVPDVELCDVGTWNLSTGVTTFTMEDFQAAIAAQDDPFIRTPKVKLGHDAPINDATPTFGKIENMYLKNDGQTVAGDLVGIPSWLAEILPSAYPQRSIEGRWNVKTAAGKTHQFVITGVALLGDVDPGVETLEDLQTLWLNGPDATVEAEGAEVRVPVGNGEVDLGKIREKVHAAAERIRRVSATVAVEDVRRAYYESLNGDQMWWWIREIQIDPPQLIVDDDEGSLYRVGYTISGDDVEFKEPAKVEIQYTDVAAGRKRPTIGGAWASKEESRPTEEEGMDPKLKAALIKKYDLGEDATDAAILAALEAEGSTPPETEETTPPAETTPPEPGSEETTPPAAPEGQTVVPEGAIVTDPETVEELKTAASNGAKAYQELQDQKRENLIGGAVKAGKFAPSRKEHFEGLFKADPEGTTQLINAMAAGVVPVELRGHSTESTEASGADAYPAHWLPEVAARKAREEAGRS